jgi:cysteinyl-tRNA synthetase
MALRIYNTLSKKIEDFKPLNGKKVGFYLCGPTVNNLIHLGHARTYSTWDLIIRYLEFLGYNVPLYQTSLISPLMTRY